MNTIPSRTIEVIRDLGLTEREAKIYVTLLGMGSGSADAVASASGIKRATTYVALESLRMLGLVLKVPHARKTRFVAKGPDELSKLAEERLMRFDAVLPFLRSMTKVDGGFSTVLYEGLEGVKKALWYRMDELSDTEYYAFYGTAQKISPGLEDLFQKWNRANAKRNIRARAFAPQHESLKHYRETDVTFLREVRPLPYESYPSDNSIEMYDSFVRIIMFQNTSAVIIENASLAQSLRSIHNLLWEKTNSEGEV